MKFLSKVVGDLYFPDDKTKSAETKESAIAGYTHYLNYLKEFYQPLEKFIRTPEFEKMCGEKNQRLMEKILLALKKAEIPRAILPFTKDGNIDFNKIEKDFHIKDSWI